MRYDDKAVRGTVVTRYVDMFHEGKFLEGVNGALTERFGIPPFSVFDARSGLWQARKAAWLSLGIKSELGRGDNCLNFSETAQAAGKGKLPRQAILAAENTDLGMRRTRVKGEAFNSGGPGSLRHELVRREKVAVVKGQGWGGGVQRRDTSFYTKKRSWEAEHGRKISTEEFREKYWDGYEDSPRQFRAIPGGGSGKNSAWMSKTQVGYRSGKQTASLGNGRAKDFSTTIHPYDGIEGDNASQTGTSIFDPVLCELFYRWFVPTGGYILDPFCGGSVRGVVASRLGYYYSGFDLRQEQIDANRLQQHVCDQKRLPHWICADAHDIPDYFEKESFDAIWTCPPYVNLEIYSDDPRDISRLSWKDFEKSYTAIINRACSRLANDRFAGIVITEVRDKSGMYVGFVPGTIRIFEEAGLRLYNDAVLLTAVGSLSIRTGRQFTSSRKFGRTHQYVLIFVKGDPRKAVEAIEGNQ